MKKQKEFKDMLTITTESQHIHTDATWTEKAFLEKIVTESSGIACDGRMIVDVKPLADVCACTQFPTKGKGWLIIYYYIEEA